jgi:hypothetical protein
MHDSFKIFFSQQPFWAITIIIFMALPIIGAVAWVIFRALRKPQNTNNENEQS